MIHYLVEIFGSGIDHIYNHLMPFSEEEKRNVSHYSESSLIQTINLELNEIKRAGNLGVILMAEKKRNLLLCLKELRARDPEAYKKYRKTRRK